MQMVAEAKVRLLLHAWATAPILEGNVVKGAIFESKEGRHAVFAKVVVDTTGDADLIARTHASFESDIDAGDIHHCINTAFLFGGVDMERWLAFRRDEPEGFSAVHGARAAEGEVLREAVRVLAQRRRAVHGSAAVGLQRRRRGGPDRRGAALAPARPSATSRSTGPRRPASPTPS